ncbi:uncharacterized protein [Panulirus ornatus]|uniref:uncharacterized protein n=1 Tax=Panulirus ornatus TaxID=150431 RepID=UPI003A861117
MEGRAKRSCKSGMKGHNDSSRKTNRSKDLLTSAAAAAAAAGAAEAAGIGTSKNALRERSRVESLRKAYLELQAAIPSVPPNTKLSKLDVLVLATTYISHLSQLLQEDDARAGHDTNNNTTKPASQGHPASPAPTPTVEGGARRVQQKGLLHPVKKWPMRARLYAGVGATDAVTLLSEQQVAGRQLRTKLSSPSSTTHAHRQPPPYAAPTLHHNHATLTHHKAQGQGGVEFVSSSTASGIFLQEFGSGDQIDKSYAYPYVCPVNPSLCEGGGSPQCAQPPHYPSSYTWEGEGGWGPHTPYDDLTSCHSPCRVSQPYTGYTGYWTAWND